MSSEKIIFIKKQKKFVGSKLTKRKTYDNEIK